MRIQHNIMAMNAYRNMGKNNSAVSNNLEKLSSGYRINRAGDDAAGLAISEKMRAQIAGLDQAQKNAQSGINLVQTAEGALTEVHDMLNRMVTLATQASNGTYSTTDIANINKEISALNNEISRIDSSTKFNGITLFNTTQAATIQVDKANAITVNLNTFSMTAIKCSTLTATNAAGQITALEGHINTISGYRADLGATQNRLEHTVNNLGVTMENLQSAESTIRDTNIADEMMAYTKNNILIQSAQAMLAQANQVPQGVLQLMQ